MRYGIGIDTGGTRYGRLRALLSLTERDLSGIPAADAQTIRSIKGMYLMPFQNAYLAERENAHVLIHQYGSDNKYWVNVMPSDDLEYCVLVSAQEHDTALRMAASARLEAVP